MMIKVIIPFIQTKANLKITTCLTPKTSHLEHLKLNIKGPNQIQNEEITFYSKSNTPISKQESLFS